MLVLGVGAALLWPDPPEQAHGTGATGARTGPDSGAAASDSPAPALLQRLDAGASAGALAGNGLRGATIVLRVTDESGAPLPGARVRCGEPEYGYYGELEDREWEDAALPTYATATTDEQGVARLSGLPRVHGVLLAADAPGRTRAQRRLVTPGEGDEVEVGPWPLEPAPTVRLHFVGDDGAPAPGVKFSLDLEEASESLYDRNFQGISDDGGLAVLEHVPLDYADAWVSARGRWLFDHYPQVLDPRQREGTIRLRRGGVVRGRVVDARGSPVAGAVVGLDHGFREGKPGDAAYPWGYSHVDYDAFRAGTLTAQDGSFECAGLDVDRAGLHCVTVYLAPEQIYASPWTDRTDGLELRLPPRHLLRGVVRGPFDPAQARLVLQEENGREQVPVPGALTRGWIGPDPALGAGGEFALTLPESVYTLRIEYPGGAETVLEKRELSADLDLGLMVLGRGASVRVVSGTLGRLPTPSVVLERFELIEDSWLDEAEVNWSRRRIVPLRERSDTWLFRGLPEGRYRVVADAGGCEPAVEEFELRAGEERDVALEPPPSGDVVVEILNGDGTRNSGRALGMLAVIADPPTARQELLDDLYHLDYPLAELTVCEDGLYRGHDLIPGEYRLNISLADDDDRWGNSGETAVGTILVEAGRTTAWTHKLGDMASVSIRVRSGDAPAAQATVVIWQVLDGQARIGLSMFGSDDLSAQTDRDGFARFASLGAGDFLAGARARDGEAMTFREFTLAQGEHEVEIALGAGAVQGSVLGPDGAPRAAHVTLHSEEMIRRGRSADERDDPIEFQYLHFEGEVAEFTAAADGAFRLERVPPGRYRVHAQSKDSADAWSEWFAIEADSTFDAGVLRLHPRSEWEWTVRGCLAWEEYDARLVLRPAQGGEIHQSIWIYSDEDECVEELELPHGLWSVELEDRDGTLLGRLAVIEIGPDRPPPPLDLPTPASVGAK